MFTNWRNRIFLGLLLASIALSLFIKFHDFFVVLSYGASASEMKEERQRYPEDYDLVEKASRLPLDARILVPRRMWMANYYLYPRKLYIFNPASTGPGPTQSELDNFISVHRIGWVALLNEDRVNLVQVGGAP